MSRKKTSQVSVLVPGFLIDSIVKSLSSIAGFEKSPATSGYEALRGRVRSMVVIVYRSGSIVYDGALEEVRAMLERVLYEHYKEGGVIVGSDEAGKGEALGPLVVAATALNPEQAAYLQSIGVMDSKLVPEDRIRILAGEVRKHSLSRSILIIEPAKLNMMLEAKGKYGNLNKILAHAHSMVLEKTVSEIGVKPSTIIVDRFDSSKDERSMRIVRERLKDLTVKAVTRGESFPCVAAASILARDSYLRWIRKKIGENILMRLKEGDYSVIGGKSRLRYYFKTCYLKH